MLPAELGESVSLAFMRLLEGHAALMAGKQARAQLKSTRAQLTRARHTADTLRARVAELEADIAISSSAAAGAHGMVAGEGATEGAGAKATKKRKKASGAKAV